VPTSVTVEMPQQLPQIRFSQLGTQTCGKRSSTNKSQDQLRSVKELGTLGPWPPEAKFYPHAPAKSVT
jgi:hypothetical protein